MAITVERANCIYLLVTSSWQPRLQLIRKSRQNEVPTFVPTWFSWYTYLPTANTYLGLCLQNTGRSGQHLFTPRGRSFFNVMSRSKTCHSFPTQSPSTKQIRPLQLHTTVLRRRVMTFPHSLSQDLHWKRKFGDCSCRQLDFSNPFSKLRTLYYTIFFET